MTATTSGVAALWLARAYAPTKEAVQCRLVGDLFAIGGGGSTHRVPMHQARHGNPEPASSDPEVEWQELLYPVFRFS